VHTYQERFAHHGLACGQVLLTPDDVVDRAPLPERRHTFDTLLGLGAVPVVNENDTVATDELRFGDNDRLAALVASMLDAACWCCSPTSTVCSTASLRGPPVSIDDLAGLAAQVPHGSGVSVGSGGSPASSKRRGSPRSAPPTR
jgi:glutamate 5-kinase